MRKRSTKYIGRGLKKNIHHKHRLGKIHLISDRCKGCNLCIEFCPQHVLEESKDFNTKGYHLPKLVEIPGEKECVGCGYCSLICPEFSIFTEILSEEEK